MATLFTERKHESLPSNLKMNPRREGNEHVKVVTLRSVRELAVPGQPLVIGEVETEEVAQTSQNDKDRKGTASREKVSEEETEAKDLSTMTEPNVPIPYP